MAEWIKVNEDDKSSYYADYATIRKAGNKVKIWTLVDFKSVKDVDGVKSLSLKRQLELDCKEERTRDLTYTFFSENMGFGNVLWSTNKANKWKAVGPDSVGMLVWETACGKK